MDGAAVLEDVFHRSKPCSLGDGMLKRWGIDIAALAVEVKAAVDEWRALPAPEA